MSRAPVPTPRTRLPRQITSSGQSPTKVQQCPMPRSEQKSEGQECTHEQKKPPPVPPKDYKTKITSGERSPSKVQADPLPRSDRKTEGQECTDEHKKTPPVPSKDYEITTTSGERSPSKVQADPLPRSDQKSEGQECTDEHKKPPPVPPKDYKTKITSGEPSPSKVQAYPLPRSDRKTEGQECTDEHKEPPPVPSKDYETITTSGGQSPSKVQAYPLPRYDRKSEGQACTNEVHLTWPPLLHQKSVTQVQEIAQSQQEAEAAKINDDIMEWWYSEEPWKQTSITMKMDAKAFTEISKNLKKALHVYDNLLSERGATLQGHIFKLEEVADDIDKVHKGVKIAKITGGTAGAVGAAAAVGGVILAPFTMGASLAVAAIGVGVAAAGGATGAGAAITKKVHTTADKKKVETILKEHSEQIEEIEGCVKFIGMNIEWLRKYDLSTSGGLDWKAVKMARIECNVGDYAGAIGAVSKSTGLIQGLAVGLDMYFSKEDSKKLKKGSETKFAKQIRTCVKQMKASLDELMKFKTVVKTDGR